MFAAVTTQGWFSPLECKRNHSATSNNMKLVHLLVISGMLHLVQRGGDWMGCSLFRPLLSVPNVTAHPSVATVSLG